MTSQPTKTSFPKDHIKVLLLENIHRTAIDILQAEGYQIETHRGSLSPTELATAIADIHLLGIRSGTKVSAEVLTNARRLLAIGAFCIGTNQIDLATAAKQGIAVFNAPFSNTRSVVELALGEMIMLIRRTVLLSARTHAGEWHKSAEGSHELRGITLGIVGYGNIGSQLSVLAESLGMKVRFFDLVPKLALGNAQPVESLAKLLSLADVVSIHVDGRPANADLIGPSEFDRMKRGSYFLNLSRGHVVDQSALAAAIANQHLAGAAVDVYPDEPDKGGRLSSPLQGLPNVILTPHVGGSTMEAQAAIGQFVADKFLNFVNHGDSSLSVSLPNVSLPPQQGSHRLLHIHRNVPGVLAKINNILAATGANIIGQFLGTSGEIGYVITDLSQTSSQTVRRALVQIPETIKLRLLY